MGAFSSIKIVLGSTNTGKTHYAVERMIARSSGVIGLPLRLLAREVYDKIVTLKGEASCALLTGEEKIIPPHARYFVCTVEAMPMDDIRAGKFACVVVDEVQLVEHPERGHIFTDRVLRARGVEETLLLGAPSIRSLFEKLLPDAHFTLRERFSTLSYAGHHKLTRLPKRSVVVAFSAPEVYALAELMRRAFGGCAIVMGGLSPRTRNAQAELYQSGEVDYLVATDAIGMGLNLDADHVAFASLRKFDGQRTRMLRPDEMGQIAGRAGRFRNDGTFGTTAGCSPMDEEDVARIENHHFSPTRHAKWRNHVLDFANLDALMDSLSKRSSQKRLVRIAPVTDELALERLVKTHEIADTIHHEHDVRRLWQICQIPDFQSLGPEAHARQLEEIWRQLIQYQGILPAAYLEKNISRLDHIEGNIDIIASRLAHIRTWSYIAHKQDWLNRQENWVKRSRAVEDRLSDALHIKLVERFVDRRTRALLSGIGDKNFMDVNITQTGEVVAGGHTLGHLHGLLFVADQTQDGAEKKALQAAAALALAPEIDRRLTQIIGSDHSAICLSDEGKLVWNEQEVAKLSAGAELLKPQLDLIGGELGSPVLCDQAMERLRDYLNTEIAQKFEPLFGLKELAEDPRSFQGARAIAHTIYENHGMLVRLEHLQLVKDTDKIARGYIRNRSGRFGYHYVFLRDLLKPASARLMSLLFAYAGDKDGGGECPPFLPPNGLSSLPDDSTYTEACLNVAGYTRRGSRIIRFDTLDTLHKFIVQAQQDQDGKEFRIARQMLASLGCSHEDMRQVLTALGYKNRTEEMSPEETESRKAEVLKAHAEKLQRDVAKAAKAAGTADEEEPKKEQAEDTQSTPISQPETDISADESQESEAVKTQTPEGEALDNKSQDEGEAARVQKNANYVPKRQRVKPLQIFYPSSELDEDGNPIVETKVELWRRVYVKKNVSHRGRPLRPQADKQPSHVAYQSGPEESTPVRAKTKPSTSGGSKKSGRSSGAQRLGEYGKLSTKRKSRPAAAQHKHKKSGWTAAPPKSEQVEASSPFAALSALTFSAPQTTSSSKGKVKKNTKNKTAKKTEKNGGQKA
jgi:ATP-dependent RNA helicase SUPV3L1/SUV3